jgi:hypothetical protein
MGGLLASTRPRRTRSHSRRRCPHCCAYRRHRQSTCPPRLPQRLRRASVLLPVITFEQPWHTAHTVAAPDRRGVRSLFTALLHSRLRGPRCGKCRRHRRRTRSPRLPQSLRWRLFPCRISPLLHRCIACPFSVDSSLVGSPLCRQGGCECCRRRRRVRFPMVLHTAVAVDARSARICRHFRHSSCSDTRSTQTPGALLCEIAVHSALAFTATDLRRAVSRLTPPVSADASVSLRCCADVGFSVSSATRWVPIRMHSCA